METSETFLTPQELTKRWNNAVSVRTLANWRSLGDGPVYVKIGAKVFYPMGCILQWEARRRRPIQAE
jgi:hypothetical protein